jgi:hypothetical protein
VNLPSETLVRQLDTHRLIPSRYCDESVLGKLAGDGVDMQALFDLDHATNDRLLAENSRLGEMDPRELVFGVPEYRVINAAFCHPHPLGSRFNGPHRGAWYAAFERDTSLAEIAFHKSVEFQEIDWFYEELSYADFLADFSASLHDLRGTPEFAHCIDEDSYVASQLLAEQLLAAGSLGVIYPSVRAEGGTCLACFRPALVNNVRRAGSYLLRWAGTPQPDVIAL